MCRLKLERCKPHKTAHQPTKCDVINDVKLFTTVYRRICCHKFLMLSNQMSGYKIKCIRTRDIASLGSYQLHRKYDNAYLSQHMRFWFIALLSNEGSGESAEHSLLTNTEYGCI